MADSGLLVGKLLRVNPQYAIMESLPGIADVYVPNSVLETSAQKLNAGETLVVEAIKHIQGNNQWMVTRIVNVIASHMAPSPQTGQASSLPSGTLSDAGKGNTESKEVVDGLVRLIVAHKGEMEGPKVALLYHAQPDAQAQ
eukprot:1655209-Rhodomonas_salina.3